MTQVSPNHLLRQMKAWQQAVCNFESTHYVTFIFNIPNLRYAGAQRKLELFNQEIHRALYGRNHQRISPQKRTRIMAFPEHPDSNLHYHAVVRTANIRRFNKVAARIWAEICPRGELYFEPEIDEPENIHHVAYYITKDFMRPGNKENVFVC